MKTVPSYFKVLWAGSTWSGIGYLGLGLPLGITWFVYLVTMLAVGFSLIVIWVGVPILVVTMMSMRWIGAFERSLANRMIDARIADPGPLKRRTGGTGRGTGPVRWAFDVLTDSHAWRVAVWSAARIVLGPVGFAVALVAAIVPVSLAASLVLASAEMLGWADWMYDADAASVVHTVSFWTLVGSPVVVAAIPMWAWASRGYVAGHRALARWSLGPSEADRANEATARAELAEEQVRIDQELHDSIGHMITMNVIQAGAGAHVFDTDPEFARQALKNVEERGRAAMGELDRIIATIRGDQPETRAPLPGMDQIEALIEASSAAGMDVDARLEPPKVPAALGRAAFGIVRESLTNAAKHAPGAHVAVRVSHLNDALTIAVVNGPGGADAPRATAAGQRHGVAGMRDRIELLGGKQRIGATPGGGFEVLAALPLGATLDGADDLDSWWDRLRETVSR